MAGKVNFDIETTLAPVQVRAALLDFTDNRPNLWPALARDQYKVLNVAGTEADVREGSHLGINTIWAVEHYDWSRPDVIRWTTTESSFCAPGSYIEAFIQERGTGSVVHFEWDRTGVGIFGRMLIGMMRVTNGKPLQSSLTSAFRQIERMYGTGPTR